MHSLNSPPDLVTRGDVATLLELPLRELTWWLWGIREHRRYEEFDIPRRSTERPRRISAPIKPIKDLQKRLAVILNDCFSPMPNVHGYVEGRSPVSNARIHKRREWLLRFDLKDFFPSINFGRVLGVFSNYPFDYPHDVAVMLAQLCCHNNQLPQGSPVSPVISNLICRGLDKELATLAKSERSYYSRYADDICISTDRRTFPAFLAKRTTAGVELGEKLNNIVEKHGFNINNEKTYLLRRTQRQRVTGLVVNEKVNVPRDYVRNLRNLLYIWRAHGQPVAEDVFKQVEPARAWPPGKAAPDFALVIRGRVEHVGSMKGRGNPTYRSLATALQVVDPSFRIPADVGRSCLKVRLFTEGSTDIAHMRAAQQYFATHAEFLDFELTTTASSAAGNDSELLKRCRSLGDTAESPCVCLFDSDSPEVLRKAVGSQGWKVWGPNCVAVKLVPPDWLEGTQSICIELLYPDAVLKAEDDDGRRLYLRSEFDKKTGIHHESSDITIPNAGNKTLVQETVHDRNGDSIGMTKTTFARHVSEEDGQFAGISFEGFRPTFEAITEAALELRKGSP